MGFMQWLSSRRFKKVLMGVVAAGAMLAPAIARAEWSRKTKNSYALVQKDTKQMMKKDGWTDAEKRTYTAHTIHFAESLAADIIKDLRMGNYADAKNQLKTLGAAADVLKDLGRFDAIADDYVLIEKALKKAEKRREVAKVKKAVRKKLPAGTYVFKSKNISITVKVKVKNGTTVVDATSNISPFVKKGEWEELKKGKPPEIVDFVEQKLIKQGLGKFHQSVRTSGGLAKDEFQRKR